ncbi:MAG: hypothetical protein DRJ40_08230 [Thermoprotei archaeon]|nr:MAG: hypothetical protein DRJ40_08230 [Thermoprotei archaeon]
MSKQALRQFVCTREGIEYYMEDELAEDVLQYCKQRKCNFCPLYILSRQLVKVIRALDYFRADRKRIRLQVYLDDDLGIRVAIVDTKIPDVDVEH